MLGSDNVDQLSWGDGPAYAGKRGGVYTCFSNKVQGLSSISAFSYYVTLLDSTGTSATALVLDTADNNSVVASVSITSLLPTTSALTTVTARFLDAVSLNASRTYRFAFCATVSTGATITHTMRLTN
jgi:hypothetical protein